MEEQLRWRLNALGAHGMQRIVVRVISTIVGFVLIRSSLFHIGNSYAFLGAVCSYRLLPVPISIVVAAILPYLQLTIGMVLLFMPKNWSAAFGWAAAISLMFGVAQIAAHVRGLNISCGCFTPGSDNPITASSIALPLVLSAVSLLGWRLHKT